MQPTPNHMYGIRYTYQVGRTNYTYVRPWYVPSPVVARGKDWQITENFVAINTRKQLKHIKSRYIVMRSYI